MSNKNNFLSENSHNCEVCNSSPCQCDLDQNNPVDMSAEAWSNCYAHNPDYDMEHDHSMDF